MQMTRRDVVIRGVALAAVTALPLPVQATRGPIVADMFYSIDEPWGAFVRGHVSKTEFDKAVLHMLETNSDHRENGEDWLFEYRYDDDDDERMIIFTAEPEHIHMRVLDIDPELGEQYCFCKGDAPGAIPISVARY
jgi:hypothetical protein